jgi:putative transposase
MPNTYTQLYIQLVFAVKERKSLIKESFRNELEKYICGIINNKQSKPLAIYCMPDHIHILVGLNPKYALSDIVIDIKTHSTRFINEKQWLNDKFNWQEGYRAFSYSRSNLDPVIQYILNQQQHHAKRSFRDEYIELLQKFNIEYNEKYLFDWIETP